MRKAVRMLGRAMIKAEPWTEAKRAPRVVTDRTDHGEPAVRSSSTVRPKAAAADSLASSVTAVVTRQGWRRTGP